MTIVPTDLLEFALRLRGSEGEVERRASSSRLYYALLHRALECLRVRPERFTQPRHGSTFRAVHDAFTAQSSTEFWYLLERFRALKQYREWADYDIELHGDWPGSMMQGAEAEARAVARRLDAYALPPSFDPAESHIAGSA